MPAVSTRREGPILVVTADNPPINALSAEVRTGLRDAVRAAAADSDVAAVLLICAGRTFFAGADITEFGKPPLEPGLPGVVAEIEDCPKPVIAAIHGTALGGGLEVALGCHYRVAVPSAKFGLPEVKLGILPGAGGTQRLPRVIGAEAALEMIVSGDPVGTDRALAAGLIDEVVGPDSLEQHALAFARRVADRPLPIATSRREDQLERTDPTVFARFRAAHAKRFRNLKAPEYCLRAVEAATRLPFAEGAAFERELFKELVAGDESRAMRHNFFAERAASKIEGLPAGTEARAIARTGVIGAGTMGTGITLCFLAAGIPVTLVETEQAALDRGVGNIRKTLETSAARGRITLSDVDKALSLLTPTLEFERLAACDLVIEAVFELMAVKQDIFRKLDRIAAPGAILASNTSYLDIDIIAAETSRPEQVLGLHFFSPANLMKLLEIVRGKRTAPEVLATAMALAKRIGKVAVVSGVCHGFIGNRMLAPRQAQANALILEGARPQDVDRVLTDFGFPMGPFQMSDLAGLDIGWDPAKTSSSTLREVLCERGRRGQKTGKGFYDYDENRNRTPSPEVEAIIAEFAAKAGKPQRDVSDEEILARLLYPMVNEGALILEEGIAQRASDIDVVWLNGYGWPVGTGGPMFWAGLIGLDEVVAGAERYLTEMTIAQSLRDKAARKEGLDG